MNKLTVLNNNQFKNYEELIYYVNNNNIDIIYIFDKIFLINYCSQLKNDFDRIKLYYYCYNKDNDIIQHF